MNIKTDKDTNKVPIELTNIRLQVKSVLAFLTNQAYSYNRKIAYSTEFTKGDKSITIDNVKICKDYYVFKLVAIDRTESFIGKRIELLTNFYPCSIGENKTKLEKQALDDFIINSVASLINTTYAVYMNTNSESNVKVEDIKPEEAEREYAILSNRQESKIITNENR